VNKFANKEELGGVEFVNGMQAGALGPVTWIKSSHSNATGNCVEMAELPDDRIAIRDSRGPEGPALVCTRDEFAGLVAGARAGGFDSVIG
jgi:hypothetical protein